MSACGSVSGAGGRGGIKYDGSCCLVGGEWTPPPTLSSTHSIHNLPRPGVFRNLISTVSRNRTRTRPFIFQGFTATFNVVSTKNFTFIDIPLLPNFLYLNAYVLNMYVSSITLYQKESRDAGPRRYRMNCFVPWHENKKNPRNNHISQ